jgi:hypothetical protein
MTYSTENKPCLWAKKYIIENLPSWIYSDNAEPISLIECKAKISSTEYTIRDIDLQIEVRELELKTGNSRHSSSFDFEKWRAQALRAKQTHLYMLNAYTYWFLLNQKEENLEPEESKITKVIRLLIEEPADFVQQLESLL